MITYAAIALLVLLQLNSAVAPRTGSEAGGAGAVGWAICVVEDLGGGAAVSSSQPPSPC
jgi:hypothetical protein